MAERYPNLIYSDLGGKFSQDGIDVEVFIFQIEGSREWTLEVKNLSGTSNVWDEAFLDDRDAYAEFKRTIEEEGLRTFLDDSIVIPFPGNRAG